MTLSKALSLKTWQGLFCLICYTSVMGKKFKVGQRVRLSEKAFVKMLNHYVEHNTVGGTLGKTQTGLLEELLQAYFGYLDIEGVVESAGDYVGVLLDLKNHHHAQYWKAKHLRKVKE